MLRGLPGGARKGPRDRGGVRDPRPVVPGRLDQYFAMERGTFIEPDKDTQALIDAMNTNARSGYKEIYEVIE